MVLFSESPLSSQISHASFQDGPSLSLLEGTLSEINIDAKIMLSKSQENSRSNSLLTMDQNQLSKKLITSRLAGAT